MPKFKSEVQFPLIMVQEYGLNLFRLAAGTALSLDGMHNVQQDCENQGWILSYVKEDKSHQEHFTYLINAAGFRTGKIDDFIAAPCEAMVEFKAAYVSQWKDHNNIQFPKIIFHGERGTPQGMGQFTPYPKGYFQLHGMTKEITLYEDGLVANTAVSCQPRLGQDFISKIEKEWGKEETLTRTSAAIKHLSQYIPSFSTASVGSKPLFGAQQIPGDDPTLRVAEVSFPSQRYARCEIVKVSSVLDMCEAIAYELVDLSILNKHTLEEKSFLPTSKLNDIVLRKKAESIAKVRKYPLALANRTMIKN